jgi:lipoprotein-anchoring transpeptidase ErfK/SrfK
MLLLALLPALAAGCGGGGEPTAAVPTPTTVDGADPQTTAAPPSGPSYTVATAAKEGTIQIYKGPNESQKASTLKHPRLINDDPKAKVPLVMLVEQQQGDWLEVALPIRPNGSKGWVKKSEFKLDDHNFRIEINLAAFNLKGFRGDKQIFDAPIAVARDDTPTPGGKYYTTELLEPPDPKGDYGPYAIGLSGHSDALLTFGGGPGQLGIHGTNKPEAIGTKVSHGCIRLKNADITKLVDIGMPLGTPVVINA